MKMRRGKKGVNLLYPDSGRGLVEDRKWKKYLNKYPDVLLLQIRKDLSKCLPTLNEKFNRQSKYFGYRLKDQKDNAYIFVQKKNLCVLLNISRDHESKLRKAGFKIRYWHNFQGRNGWLTGWYIPHDNTDVKLIVKWFCKAFEEDM